MKLIPLALSVLCVSNALAQNKHLDHKYAVKLSNLLTVTGNSVIYQDSLYTRTGSYSKYANPVPALQMLTAKKNIHEIELSDLTISRREQTSNKKIPGQNDPVTAFGDIVTITSVALRYEYIINFAKKKNSRLVPALGFAGMPYYSRFSTIPVITSYFPVKDNFLGLRGFIVPRLSFYATKRVFFDLNVPITLFDMQYQTSRAYNSVLPAAQQRISSFDFHTLPAYYSFRLGVGVKL